MSFHLNGASVLITGGTGSFGRAFVGRALRLFPHVKRLVVFSRDEYRQQQLRRQVNHPALHFLLGDVRDADRLYDACRGVDVVIHAAALKQVATAETFPLEYVRTNVLGTENVVRAAQAQNVARVLHLSTDKAAAPAGAYGATKLCAEKTLTAAAQAQAEAAGPIFSSVRFGNFFGSRGSVVPFFREQAATAGWLPLRHAELTRFHVTLAQATDHVLFALAHARGGEVFVPRLPAYRVADLARAAGPAAELRITRPVVGEKVHETLLTAAEAPHTYVWQDHYVISPLWPPLPGGVPVAADFSYTSHHPARWLDLPALQALLHELYAQNLDLSGASA